MLTLCSYVIDICVIVIISEYDLYYTHIYRIFSQLTFNWIFMIDGHKMSLIFRRGVCLKL